MVQVLLEEICLVFFLAIKKKLKQNNGRKNKFTVKIHFNPTLNSSMFVLGIWGF